MDDEPDFRAILRVLLEREGYRVSEAPDGEAGVASFAEHPADLVLLDIQMPKLDGLQACRKLRGTAAGRTVPILLLTVRSQLATVAEGLAAGANDYVLKPFDPQDLLARVALVLDGIDRDPG